MSPLRLCSCGAVAPSDGTCPACRRDPRPRKGQHGGRGGRRWMETRRRVLRSALFRCAYCGGPANEVDHRVSLAAGGSDRLTNLQAVCHRCHVEKSQAERVNVALPADWRPEDRR